MDLGLKPIDQLTEAECHQALAKVTDVGKLRALVGFLQVIEVAAQTQATGKAEVDIQAGKVKRLRGPYDVKVA